MIQRSPISLLGAELIFAKEYFVSRGVIGHHIFESELRNYFENSRTEKVSIFAIFFSC